MPDSQILGRNSQSGQFPSTASGYEKSLISGLKDVIHAASRQEGLPVSWRHADISE